MSHTDAKSSHQQLEADSTGRSSLDWAQRASAVDDVLSELRMLAHRRQRRRIRVGVTALAAAVLLTAGLIWRRPSVSSPEYSVTSMVVVAPAHRTLPDGSTIDLKDGANIEVAFTPGVRAVTLLHGTAHFQVAKNPHWPFVVTATGITVRAVGTAFCVGIETKSVEVIVTEGKVSVASQTTHESLNAIESKMAPRSAFVGVGEHVVVEAIPGAAQPLVFDVTPLDVQELAYKTAWLNPRLEFNGTPLGVVVMMFNQHNRLQLKLDDPSLQNLELSGILRSDNVSALLQLLDTNFHIQAEHHGSDVIILRKAP